MSIELHLLCFIIRRNRDCVLVNLLLLFWFNSTGIIWSLSTIVIKTWWKFFLGRFEWKFFFGRFDENDFLEDLDESFFWKIWIKLFLEDLDNFFGKIWIKVFLGRFGWKFLFAFSKIQEYPSCRIVELVIFRRVQILEHVVERTKIIALYF